VPRERPDLKRQNEEALVQFLRTELQLASTFCQIAGSTRDEEHRAKLLNDIRKVMETVQRFEARITDPAIRKELNDEAHRLSAIVSR
jgi:hypothetical protein